MKFLGPGSVTGLCNRFAVMRFTLPYKHISKDTKRIFNKLNNVNFFLGQWFGFLHQEDLLVLSHRHICPLFLDDSILHNDIHIFGFCLPVFQHWLSMVYKASDREKEAGEILLDGVSGGSHNSSLPCFVF